MTTIFKSTAVLLAILSLFAGGAVASDIETPKYTLLESFEGPSGDTIEVRRYAPSIQAVTRSKGTNSGFRTLAKYIFGGNATGEEIAMTAPVATVEAADAEVMAFTMPSAYNMASLPAPDDERVELLEVPEKVVAVISFSGWATEDRVDERNLRLIAALEGRGWEFAATPVLNQYDPPWRLPFNRTNEIHYELDPTLFPVN